MPGNCLLQVLLWSGLSVRAYARCMEPVTDPKAQAEQLHKLADLHRTGVLSDEEYKAAAAGHACVGALSAQQQHG